MEYEIFHTSPQAAPSVPLKVGSNDTVDNNDQRAKIRAISAFPPWTLKLFNLSSLLFVTLEGLQLLWAECRCRLCDDEGACVSPIPAIRKNLDLRPDRYCQPHHRTVL